MFNILVDDTIRDNNIQPVQIADGIITVVDGCSFRVHNFNFLPDKHGRGFSVFTWYGLNSTTGDAFRLIYKNVGTSNNTDTTYTFLDMDGISFEEFDTFVLFNKRQTGSDIKVAYFKLHEADKGGDRETTKATTTTTTETTSSTSAAQTDSTVEDSNAQDAQASGAQMASFSLLALAVLSLSLFMVV
jgi:hypothetical protein